jgi:hypothetical protein
MKTVFATFNFRDSDLAQAEEHYNKEHVRLTLQLPGLCQYITGLIEPHPHRPSPHRAAFNYFDDAAALRWALHKSPAAKPLLHDGAAHLRVNRWLELDSEIIMPFESRRPGLRCFVLAAEFELKLESADPEAAEQRYRHYQVGIAEKLPNLRHFMISKYEVGNVAAAAGATALSSMRNPLRMAMLVFDSSESLRDAYHSPIGMELRKEQRDSIVNSRVYHIEATVQL